MLGPDSVVVITGASRGIGAATARAFAQHGCRLVLGARSEDAMGAVRDAIVQQFGVEVRAVRCDVRRDEDVQGLVDTALDHFGRLDVLVNNAAIGYYGLVEATSDEDMRDLLETNLIGVLRVVRTAVPVMRRQRGGHIVNVGSAVGKRGWPFHGPYAATKFALTGLTQTLRAELAGSGVTVSLVIPSSTTTDFFRTAKVALRGYEPKPMGIIQAPEKVAAKVVRSANHPAAEINAVPVFRLAFVLAEAFPWLADFAARRYYLWMAERLGLDASSPATGPADATPLTDGKV